MPIYKETTDDLRLKYVGCIVSYDKSPLMIDDISKGDSKFHIIGRVYKEGDWESKTVTMTSQRLNIACLPRTAINLGSSVVVLNLRKAIQGTEKYKRAISAGNTELFDPFKKERELLRSQPAKLGDPLIYEAWINNEFYSAEEALRSVSSYERIAAAFHPEYYFGIKYCTNAIMLFRRNNMIGRVNPVLKEVILKPPAHPYAEELSELGLNVKKVSK